MSTRSEQEEDPRFKIYIFYVNVLKNTCFLVYRFFYLLKAARVLFKGCYKLNSFLLEGDYSLC